MATAQARIAEWQGAWTASARGRMAARFHWRERDDVNTLSIIRRPDDWGVTAR